MKKKLNKPFFANYLEMQSKETNQVKGGTNPGSDTVTYPASADQLITLKYPSDGEVITNPQSDPVTAPGQIGG